MMGIKWKKIDRAKNIFEVNNDEALFIRSLEEVEGYRLSISSSGGVAAFVYKPTNGSAIYLMAMALGIARELRKHLDNISLNWPGEILVAGLTLGEGFMASENRMIEWINVSIPQEEFDVYSHGRVTSLGDLGIKMDERLERSMLKYVGRYLIFIQSGKTNRIVDEFLSMSKIMGKKVVVEINPYLRVSGTVSGFDKDGSIIIAAESGRKNRVREGWVEVLN